MVAVFGKRPKHEDVRERPVDPDELRRSVDEGMLIARSAIVIAVANRIILSALQQHESFDARVVAEVAREELRRFAAEQREDAERMREIRAVAQNARGRSRHQHDYKRGDDLKLRTREATYTELAERLEASSEDPSFVDAIVIAARQRAWDDIGSTVIGRLGWAAGPADDYEVGLEDRLQELAADIDALRPGHPPASD
ncbi:hypothetical protein [Curtobacterium sp. MCBD17_028]|uniref:hypothetical protein n=1 Tax=Curtobacterium sp. MCBD17_028 TaxID=2175670 RepID=UPI000DA72C81|nr:hypothetical protein [Curtobacterium sp. MCBD17_028]PZE24172.1 hypothetical protein DEI86_12970 [Curtobacterium sp. MCBD17_028]